jgi:hypothetical protein
MADMKVSYRGLAFVLVAMLPSLLFAEEEGLSLYDPSPTATKLKQAAMHGNVEAMSRLAGAYQSNDGANRISFLKEDRESAYIWFSISALQCDNVIYHSSKIGSFLNNLWAFLNMFKFFIIMHNLHLVAFKGTF